MGNEWLDLLLKIEEAEAAEVTRQHAEPADDAPEALARRVASPAADDADVMWRVAVMRPQVPPWGPIRRLLARLDTPATDAPRCCGSCGDPLPEGYQFRCAHCIRAIEIALNSVREGVK